MVGVVVVGWEVVGTVEVSDDEVESVVVDVSTDAVSVALLEAVSAAALTDPVAADEW